jgi:hypothetical protein
MLLPAIAAALNDRGITTAAGSGQWKAAQVQRVLTRLGALELHEVAGTERLSPDCS